MSSCTKQGEQARTQYYNRPNIGALEARSPETVITETFGYAGEILSPKIFSPKAQISIYRLPRQISIKKILDDLVISEKVARRQYDELLMFPEMTPFTQDLMHIRGDEYEHEKILECINSKLSLNQYSPGVQNILKKLEQPVELPKVKFEGKTWFFDKQLSQLRNITNPNDYLDLNEEEVETLTQKTAGNITLTPKAVGELYATMLGRFKEMEQKSVSNYEEFLVKVQETEEALNKQYDNMQLSDDQYRAIMAPLNSLKGKVNKHLNEERVHLDVVDAMRDMFNSMKLGNVY